MSTVWTIGFLCSALSFVSYSGVIPHVRPSPERMLVMGVCLIFFGALAAWGPRP